MMFLLIDRVPGAVSSILNSLEEFIYQAGLDDMRQCADTITTVLAGRYAGGTVLTLC